MNKNNSSTLNDQDAQMLKSIIKQNKILQESAIKNNKQMKVACLMMCGVFVAMALYFANYSIPSNSTKYQDVSLNVTEVRLLPSSPEKVDYLSFIVSAFSDGKLSGLESIQEGIKYRAAVKDTQIMAEAKAVAIINNAMNGDL